MTLPPRPKIKLRTLVKWPSRVAGGDLLTVEKENGVVTIDLALSEASITSSVADTEATTVVLVTDGATPDDPEVVERIAIDDLIASVSGVAASREIISGAGLTGGGDLSADRTLAVGAGTGITVNANDVALDTSNARNVDHSGVTITAGAGLTGGGTIESTRTLDVGAGTGITVNANDVALSAVADQRVMANISGGALAPAANTLTAILDAILGNTQGALLTRQASAWVKLDPGTSGHFLKSQGAGANLAYAALTGGGDMLAANDLSDVSSAATAFGNIKQAATTGATGVIQLADAAALIAQTSGTALTADLKIPRIVTSGTFSGGALQLPLGSYTAYKTLRLYLEDILPSSDGAQLYLNFSTNNGSSYEVANYGYFFLNATDSSSTPSGSNSASDSQIVLSGPTENSAVGGLSLTVEFFNLSSATSYSSCKWHGVGYDDNARFRHFTGAGGLKVAQDTDNIQVNFSAGNIASGSWRLEAIP